MHVIDFLLRLPAKHSQTRPENLSLLPLQGSQGPCPGQVFSYSNWTENPIPVLAIPGTFIEFPGSLRQLMDQVNHFINPDNVC